MKAKKALKRLSRAEAILSEVMADYQVREPQLKASLTAAKTSLAQARETVTRHAASIAAKKKAASAKVETPAAPPAKKKASVKAAARKTSAPAKRRSSPSPRRTQEILEMAEAVTQPEVEPALTTETPQVETAVEHSVA
jgi:hypothetical protein